MAVASVMHPHRAAQGVDLADDLALGDATDRRVAAHLADGVAVHRQQGGAQAHPRRRQRRLDARRGPHRPRSHQKCKVCEPHRLLRAGIRSAESTRAALPSDSSYRNERLRWKSRRAGAVRDRLAIRCGPR